MLINKLFKKKFQIETIFGQECVIKFNICLWQGSQTQMYTRATLVPKSTLVPNITVVLSMIKGILMIMRAS